MNEYKLDMPLLDLFEDWCKSNPRIRSAETIRLMQTSVNHFQNFLTRPALLSDLTEENVTSYLRFRRGLGRKPATVERELSKLCSLWRWGAARGWVPGPMVSIKKEAPSNPTAWSRDELNQLFDTAESYRAEFVKDTQRTSHGIPVHALTGNVVMVAFLRLLFDTGERFNAARLVRWQDIDIDGRFVTFRGETRKSTSASASDNIQRFTKSTRNALRRLKEAAEAVGRFDLESNVFPPLDKSAYYYHMKQILEMAGLPKGRRNSFHKLRRTHATHLYVVGGDATLALGHSNDAMTRSYYLDPKYTRKEFGSDRLSGSLTGMISRSVRKMKAAFGYW